MVPIVKVYQINLGNILLLKINKFYFKFNITNLVLIDFFTFCNFYKKPLYTFIYKISHVK